MTHHRNGRGLFHRLPLAPGTLAVWALFGVVTAGVHWWLDSWLAALAGAILLFFDPFFFVRLPLAVIVAKFTGPRLGLLDW